MKDFAALSKGRKGKNECNWWKQTGLLQFFLSLGFLTLFFFSRARGDLLPWCESVNHSSTWKQVGEGLQVSQSHWDWGSVWASSGSGMRALCPPLQGPAGSWVEAAETGLLSEMMGIIPAGPGSRHPVAVMLTVCIQKLSYLSFVCSFRKSQR